MHHFPCYGCAGFLTDLVQVRALAVGAAYILCPCCVGNIRQSVELAMEAAGTQVKPSKTNGNSESNKA